MTEKPTENGNKRNPDGTFAQGNPGGPGRPKGSLSITSEIKKKLEECPEGKERTYLEYLVDQILKKAIIDNDNYLIAKIWAYIDGQPMQQSRVDLESEGGIIFNIMPANGEKKDET